MQNNHKPFDPYKYIPFLIIVFLIAKFIFKTGNLTWFLSSFKSLIFASIIIYLLSPVVRLIKTKLKFRHTISVLLTYFIVFAFIALFIMLIAPTITDSVNALINNFPSTEEMMAYVNNSFLQEFVSADTIDNLIETIDQSVVKFSSNILSFSSSVISSITGFISNLALLILSLFMAFYALRDSEEIPPKLKRLVRAFLPKKYADWTIRVGRLTDKALKQFLIGKMYTCIILGLLVSIAIYVVNMLSPLHIPYAPLMGLIIGLTNIIPYIGPFIGTIPCLFFALFSGVWEAVALLIVVIVMQQIDNIIVSPKIIGNTVGLKPFWVVASVTIGGSFFGAMGMILAVPIASVIIILVEERVARVTP
ncbi:AI-2E family transporter [Vallitalea pronyensis]|uniref:AI-2E family transporter n=1 Tax=Vallitalea pronyensis TaxID=1348613 RepID=A0A8J8SIC3_9FIRM|nr:AI-2E family transporter [Vallitalea pronyensis]QUI24314.1 AI-2E family transporter [Vallitalea pronyensis]